MITDSIKATIEQALDLLPSSMDSIEARVMLLAIGLQESRFLHRYQVVQDRPGVKGPARGFWQFEVGGGTKGVMTHRATAKHAERICELRNVEFDAYTVWRAFETDDILAACMARLLLFSDPHSLPRVTEPNLAWAYYIRNWRPGKPHRGTWAAYHAAAVLAAERRRANRSST